MRCGLSTACFFPEDTLSSLKKVVAANIPVVEIFFNTFSEIEDTYIIDIENVLHQSNTEVVSVHPFSSPMESFFFASNYPGRFDDGVRLYRRIFEAAKRLGAHKVVFHGDTYQNISHFSMKNYAFHFLKLAEIAKEYGIQLCQENVSYCRISTPDSVCKFKKILDGNCNFTLDSKQAHRNNINVLDMAKAMGNNIEHIHISDYNHSAHCILPGKGELDFPLFFSYLKSIHYKGDLILELYKDGFKTTQDLIESLSFLNTFL